jgi:energy-coupling factor transporter ATP-binding protein EcfA2
MKRLICLLIALFTFIPLNGIYAQIKIGELKNGSVVITHDLQDLLQAIEKEYSMDTKKVIKFLYAKIMISKDNKYWLAAGNHNPNTNFKMAVQLVLNSKTNELHVSRISATITQYCSDCNSPNCALIFDDDGNINGCSDCDSGNSKDFCNHNITSESPAKNQVVVERYLLKH